MRLKAIGKGALLGSAFVLSLQVGASAHFVWAEPATAGDGVQVFFGEYPELREGAPLLDKVAGTHVYALDGKSRRELKSVKQEHSFLYEGLQKAPVAVAHLDYGILQRGETPPYMLRYEAQLLAGTGGPQSLAQLARLSQIKTELPLSVSLQPIGADKLGVTVLLNGKPVAAEVAHRGPAATDMAKDKTSPEGVLELPVTASGWYHVRISAEDGKPTTFQGKEGKFTRTYLSLMFNAAGGARPAVVPAAQVAAAAPKPDADAVRLLKDAQDARANWKEDFPGFTADAVYWTNGKEVRGKITVGADLKVIYDLGDKDAEATLRPSFGSLVAHRRGGPSEDYNATWRDPDPHALGRAINLNDDLGSFYRIRDRQILQVNRSMGAQRFTTDVLENETTKFGFLPKVWTVAFFDTKSNVMSRVSTTRATWTWIGDVFLPATLEVVTAQGDKTTVNRLVLSNQKLLK